MNTDLVSYYRERAKEYEKVYAKPERQRDIATATKFLQETLNGKTVFEAACGTGFWTERIAQTATFIYATDINESVITIAQSKTYPGSKVKFELADVYKLRPSEKCESAFAGFIWSHIPLQNIDTFVQRVCECVLPGGLVVFMDNNYVEGSNHAVTKVDHQGNTYQLRTLDNGTQHLVLKNFPKRQFVEQKLSVVGSLTDFIDLKYYWIAICKLQ